MKKSSLSLPSTHIHDLPEKTLLLPQEAAKFFRVSRQTIYRWIDLGLLEGRKIAGTTVRIPREAIIKISREST